MATVQDKTRAGTTDEQEQLEAAEGCMPPYAQEYKWQHGSVPWSTFTVYLEESFGDAPWLSLLPPEAQRSLHTWGRCIFSQTALCKRGSVSVDRYGDWLRDASSFRLRTSPADTLAKCCAAFAHSPLSLVIDVQVAAQCASLAMRELMGTERGRMVLPSYVEDKLDFVCAAGCGKDLSRRFVCNDQFGHRVKYCSDKCARAHVSRLPEALKIFLCWPKAWVDNAYTDELTTPNTRERTTETSTSTQAQGASAVTSKTAQPSESSVHQAQVEASPLTPPADLPNQDMPAIDYLQVAGASQIEYLLHLTASVRKAQVEASPLTHPTGQANQATPATEPLHQSPLASPAASNEASAAAAAAQRADQTSAPAAPTSQCPEAESADQTSAPAAAVPQSVPQSEHVAEPTPSELKAQAATAPGKPDSTPAGQATTVPKPQQHSTPASLPSPSVAEGSAAAVAAPEHAAAVKASAAATMQTLEDSCTGSSDAMSTGEDSTLAEPTREDLDAGEGFMSPYAQEYKRSYLSVPWAIFTVCLNESFEYAPWLSLLPPEAQRSLHTWGRCIFSQTALCKRGSVSIDRYGDWLRDASSLRQRTSPADTLAKCCAAFAHSPLSLAIDLRAAVQCVSLALKEVHGTEQGRMVLPSYVEHQLDCVCAAGCGGDLSTGFTCMGRYSHQVKYCSDKCAQTHVSGLPERLKIFLCWPKAWVDNAYTEEVSTPNKKRVSAPPLTQEEERAAHTATMRRMVASLKQQSAQDHAPSSLTTARAPAVQPVTSTDAPAVNQRSPSSEDTNAINSGCSAHVSERPGASAGAEHTPLPLPAQPTQPTPPIEPAPANVSIPTAEPQPQPNPPVPAPSHPTPVSHTTPATTHAPDSPCTTVQRLTEADLARISALAREAWENASRGKRPMLWHVRRLALERVCARMGLPELGVQALLWVASQRGDAWGSLTALFQADPGGLCLPPELRIPYRVWAAVSELTSDIVFYTLSEEAVCSIASAFLESGLPPAQANITASLVYAVCAVCGRLDRQATVSDVCPDCAFVYLCSQECRLRHKEVGKCALHMASTMIRGTGTPFLPDSCIAGRKAKQATDTASTASDQQAPHTSDPTPHPSSHLQRDACATAGCPAAAVARAPSRSVSAQRARKPVSAAQALAAEYRQCVEGNPLLQRVAAVVMPRGAEREPESAAVVAAQQLLIAASGLLDARDLEEVLAAAGV